MNPNNPTFFQSFLIAFLGDFAIRLLRGLFEYIASRQQEIWA